jgi:hypothetical protein
MRNRGRAEIPRPRVRTFVGLTRHFFFFETVFVEAHEPHAEAA